MRKGVCSGDSRSIAISTTFTVYFDGQFWVGVTECISAGRYPSRSLNF